MLFSWRFFSSYFCFDFQYIEESFEWRCQLKDISAEIRRYFANAGRDSTGYSEPALQKAKHAHSGQFALHKHLAACTEEHKQGQGSVRAEIMFSASLLLK